MRLPAVLILLALPLGAQTRDFLTHSEIDQIREAQEPNDRITLYAKFARDRVEMARNLLSKDRSGRATMVHDALDDYSKILDATDEVIDEALRRTTDISKGLKALTDMERDVMPMLQKIRDGQPKDLDRYEFVLKTAMDTTKDSMELAEQDMGKRTKDVEARDEREKKALEEATAPVDREEREAAAKANAEKAAAEKAAGGGDKPRKPPTLLRPGEKVGEKLETKPPEPDKPAAKKK